MKRLLTVALLLASCAAAALAQHTVTGRLIDKSTKEPVAMGTVQLLRKDSTFITGIISKEDGTFSLTTRTAKGSCILKVSSIGYITTTRTVALNSPSINLGDVSVATDAVMLKEAVVAGQAAKVTVSKDTFVYNASAYRTPEGSVVEELIKRLPGAEVDDEGNVTINGKTVKKIRVDGKEFMTGDTKTAIKNLPTSLIDRIKAYDEKSDLAKVTGIDDGEEETTLDFGLKRGAKLGGFFTNNDFSIGTHSRYAERVMGAYTSKTTQVMAFGNFDNVGGRGFPGGGGRGRWGGNNNGLSTNKMAALNFNYEGTKVKLNGSVRWNHSNKDIQSVNSTENFVLSNAGTRSFSNSTSMSLPRSNSWNTRLRIEWNPDSLTNILFRPRFSYSSSDGRQRSQSAAFSDDPFAYITDVMDGQELSVEALNALAAHNILVNTNFSNSLSYGDNRQLGGMLQINRKLNQTGRNITLRMDAAYTDAANKSLSLSNVHLYQQQNEDGTDHTYQTNRYNLTPSTNYNIAAQATYSEPLWKATYLQFSYKFQYSYQKSDRATYDFSNLGETFFDQVTQRYRDFDSYLNLLPGASYEDYLDQNLSRYSEYRNYTHNIEMMFRMIREKYKFNIGILVQPQHQRFIQRYQGKDTDTQRSVTNIAPSLDFRYQPSKVQELRLNYRGTTAQPSMSQLLDITDDSDPLNITMGNPGLKPSFSQNLWGWYRNYISAHQQFINAYVGFSTTNNAITNRVTYDPATGGRITRPENINGNWTLNAGATYNASIDSAGVWNVNFSPSISYQHNVGYVSLDAHSDAQKNVVKSLSLRGRIEAGYRNSWVEALLDASADNQHSTSQLQPNSNLNTWQFAYGGSLNFTMPWGMQLSTDLHNQSRRGYNDSALNTNELLWNAQLSQSFLKGNALTVMLQYYDILHQQSTLSRAISANMRSDTQYNNINAYGMLHIVYRFNAFGGKNGKNGGPQGGPGMGGPGGRRGPGMGGPGGRRPMMF